MDKQLSCDLLNKAVADELQAVHQYMYFHFHLDDQGFGPLSVLFSSYLALQSFSGASESAGNKD